MSAILLSSLSTKDLAEFFSSFDTVLTDCDGVIWLENLIIEGAPDVLNLFRKMGKKIFYVTNNSTKTREEFLVKFEKLGFTAFKEEVLCTSYLTACYLSDLGFKGKVYVIGSKGLCKELETVGISHTEIGPDNLSTDFGEFLQQFKKDPNVTAVVVGFDEHYSYIKMLKACTYLDDPKCLFIATNTDEKFPMKTELVIPGTGSIVSGVETCSGRKAFKIGKPNAYIRDVLSKHYNIDPKRTIMIGDRGNTDILLGSHCGFKTLLVLTGVTSLEEVKMWQSSEDKELQNCVPDYYLQSIGDILNLLDNKKLCDCTRACECSKKSES